MFTPVPVPPTLTVGVRGILKDEIPRPISVVCGFFFFSTVFALAVGGGGGAGGGGGSGILRHIIISLCLICFHSVRYT